MSRPLAMYTDFTSFLPEDLSRFALELLVSLVLVFPWFWARAQGALVRGVFALHYRWGMARAVFWLVRGLEILPISDPMRSHLRRLRTSIHESLGKTEVAVAGAREFAAHARADGCWSCANGAVNAFINAGYAFTGLEMKAYLKQ